MDPISLVGASIGIAVLHTAAGVDHTLPFIAVAKAQRWSVRKLWAVVTVCGVAHVASSILLALVGVGLGTAMERVLEIELVRGKAASSMLVISGLVYAAWGLWKVRSQPRHTHEHALDPALAAAGKPRFLTMAVLFLVFVFGPCEFLIAPLFAAYRLGPHVAAAVALTFSLTTVLTMLVITTAGYFGLRMRALTIAEGHLHAMAGTALALSGLSAELLG
jgi:nickel/cobalt transporter (NicO) family protein